MELFSNINFFLLTIPLFFLLPGYVLLKFLHIKGRGLGFWTLCIGSSLTVLPLILYLGALIGGLNKTSIVLSILISSFILYGIYLLFKRKKNYKPVEVPSIFGSNRLKYISLLLIIIIALLAFSTDYYLKTSSGRVFGTVLGDNDKHHGMVVSLLTSKSFPPTSAFVHPGKDIPLYYYFYFYLIVASFYLCNSSLISLMSTFSLFFGVVAGLFTLCLAMIAGNLFERKRAPFFATLVMFCSGFQIIWLVIEKYLFDNLIRWPVYLDDWTQNIVMMMPHTINWAPQHFFAAFIFLIGLLLFYYAPRKILMIPVGAFLTGSIMGSSIYSFVCILTGLVILFVLRLCCLFRKFSAKELLSWFFYFGLTVLFALPLYLALKRAQTDVYHSIFDIVYLRMLNPLSSPIFGVVREGTGFISRIFWGSTFYLERLGPFLLIGLMGISGWWNKAKGDFTFQALLAVGLTAFFTGLFMKLPGPQNEYGKYSSILLVAFSGVLFSGGAACLFSGYFLKTKTPSGKVALRDLVRIPRLKKIWHIGVFYILVTSLILGLASGLWSYYWAIVDVKINHSRWPPYDDYLEFFQFIRKNIPRDAVIHAQRGDEMVDYGERKVLVAPKLWPFPTISNEDAKIAEDIIAQTSKFYNKNQDFQGEIGFFKGSYQFFRKYGVEYFMISRDDSNFFDERKKHISSNYYDLIYEDNRAALYKLR